VLIEQASDFREREHLGTGVFMCGCGFFFGRVSPLCEGISCYTDCNWILPSLFVALHSVRWVRVMVGWLGLTWLHLDDWLAASTTFWIPGSDDVPTGFFGPDDVGTGTGLGIGADGTAHWIRPDFAFPAPGLLAGPLPIPPKYFPWRLRVLFWTFLLRFALVGYHVYGDDT